MGKCNSGVCRAENERLRAENKRLTVELHSRINWWSEEYSKVCDRANAAEAREAKAMEDMRERLEANAEQIMLAVVNEWHHQVGLSDVLKSKLTKRIADTIATGVFAKALRALPTEVQNDA